MKKLIQAWDWFNGKKTFIGVALMVGTQPLFSLIEQPYQILAQPIPACFPKIISLMIWAGTAIGTIGGIHKMIKMKAETPAT